MLLKVGETLKSSSSCPLPLLLFGKELLMQGYFYVLHFRCLITIFMDFKFTVVLHSLLKGSLAKAANRHAVESERNIEEQF